MTIRSRYKWFIRIGLMIIGVAGLLFALGDALIPQEGTMANAEGDPEGFASLVTGKGFKIWAIRGLIGVPLETIGTLALFMGLLGTHREKIAFWGMLLCILGDLFGTGLFTVMTFIFPEVGHLIQSGHEAAASVATLEGFMPIFFGSMIITYVGLALLAVAIWNSKIFPKWSGVIVVIGFVLIAVESYAVQIIANVTWGAAYLWMAIYSWNKISKTS